MTGEHFRQEAIELSDKLAEAGIPIESHVEEMQPAVAIVSGGLDSTVLVYDMINQGYVPHLLSFDYGQRHKKEILYAERTAHQLGLKFDVIDLTSVTHLISNSALTCQRTADDDLTMFYRDDEKVERKIEVPEGHYAEDNMALTVVPNRNMIMLSIACGVAVNEKAKTIGTGVHAGDHYQYPDCRPKFIFAAGQAMLSGTAGFHNFNVDEDLPAEYTQMGYNSVALPIYAPFLNKSKADIAYRGIELGVQFEWTWSCYKGEENHCGRCGTCVERLEAIDEAADRWRKHGRTGKYAVLDNTVYEDSEYWKEVTKDAR